VLTGVSGSGKSSLAFDIIFAEGQRRFMECLSAYARQFVEQMGKPEIDSLTGLPPTVAVEQRESRGSNKSTVATVTETAQYLRLLYAKIGVPHAPKSGRPLVTGTLDMAIARMKAAVTASKSGVYLLAPLVRSRKGHHRPLADAMAKRGFSRLRCDGELFACEKFAGLDRYSEHDVEVVLGEWKSGAFVSEGPAKTERVALELALTLGSGTALLATTKGKNLEHLSTRRVDPDTGEAFADLDPKHFSWNSPKGWCPDCRGHGKVVERFAGEEAESILENAISDRLGDKVCPTCSGQRLNPVARAVKLYPPKGDAVSLPLLLAKQPGDVAEFMRHLKLDERAKVVAAPVIPEILSRLSFLENVGLGYLSLDRAADTLSGGEARRIRLAAQLGSNLAGALYVLDEPSIGLHSRDNLKLIQSLRELRDRGNTVLVVEHDEDTLRAADRLVDLGPAAGIHGGEIIAQGTPDEVAKTAGSITALHLREPMKHPLRGTRREVIVGPALARGRVDAKAKKAGEMKSSAKGSARGHEQARALQTAFLTLSNARLRNLKGFDLSIPLGRLTVIGGVSGAGKSTLISDLLAPVVIHAVSKKAARITGAEAVKAKLVATGEGKPAFDALLGADAIRQVVVVDQSPIGKTPRSTPATYMGAFDLIRELLANASDSKLRGHTAGFFSFNTTGGRCETCSGAGRVKLEMNFMPDTYVPCEDCGGMRYGPAVRDIRWNGKNAAEILAMSFEEAEKYFAAHARLRDLCGLMVKTGLGYLTLGQSSPTLSGGEAQRLKLATELAKGLPGWAERMGRVTTQKNLYLLEEPTVGLHQADCEKLIGLLHALVDQGHTVVVVEHHLDVLAEADWLVEIGPEGGDAGGELLYAGAPEGLLKVKRSPTAPFLKTIRGMV
jgi:excinuclease ABC subunit A